MQLRSWKPTLLVGNHACSLPENVVLSFSRPPDLLFCSELAVFFYLSTTEKLTWKCASERGVQAKCKANHCNRATGICLIHINGSASLLLCANFVQIDLLLSHGGGLKFQRRQSSGGFGWRKDCGDDSLGMHISNAPALQLAQFSGPCQDNSELGQLSRPRLSGYFVCTRFLGSAFPSTWSKFNCTGISRVAWGGAFTFLRQDHTKLVMRAAAP